MTGIASSFLKRSSRGERRDRYIHAVAQVGGVLSGLLLASAASALAVTDVTISIPGIPASVSYDASSDMAYVATEGGLFQTRVADPMTPFALIPGGAMARGWSARLAPGGSLALRSTPDPSGAQRIEVSQLPSIGPLTIVPPMTWTPITRPVSVTPPEGTATSVGWRGASLLLYRPAEDPSGHSGQWEWTLHSANGRLLGTLMTDDERPFSRSVSGEAFAFRFRNRIEVRGLKTGPSGTTFGVIHSVPGRYRFQTASADGRVVVAADADFRNRIMISASGARRRLDLGTEVHGARLSPDGSVVVVWLRDGRFHVFDPRAGGAGAALRLPFTFANVTSAHVRDDGLVTLSLAQRDAAVPSGYSARLVQVRAGAVLWNRTISPTLVTRTIPRILHAELDEVVLHDFESVRRLGPPSGPGGGP